jgi:hypothetical protein
LENEALKYANFLLVTIPSLKSIYSLFSGLQAAGFFRFSALQLSQIHLVPEIFFSLSHKLKANRVFSLSKPPSNSPDAHHLLVDSQPRLFVPNSISYAKLSQKFCNARLQGCQTVT